MEMHALSIDRQKWVEAKKKNNNLWFRCSLFSQNTTFSLHLQRKLNKNTNNSVANVEEVHMLHVFSRTHKPFWHVWHPNTGFWIFPLRKSSEEPLHLIFPFLLTAKSIQLALRKSFFWFAHCSLLCCDVATSHSL